MTPAAPAATQATPATTTPAASPRGGPFAAIAELARTCATRHTFFSKALGCIAEACDSPYAAYHARSGAEVMQDDCHRGRSNPGFWKERVQRYLTESLAEGRARATLLSARQAELRIALISVPLFDKGGATMGALALVAPITDVDARPRVALVESLAALTSCLAASVGAAPATAGQAGVKEATHAAARAAAFESVEELAFNITNTLRNKLGGELVALGLVSGRRVRIISISGLDDVSRRSPGVVCIQAAMEECLDFGRAVSGDIDASDDQPAPAYRLHRQWRQSARGASVASIPLMAGDKCVAVLSLRRRADKPLRADELEQIKTTVEPYAGALLLVRAARRSVLRHVRDALHERVAAFAQPERHALRIAVGVVLVAATWFFFGTLNYDVAVPCVVTPAEVRHVSMPLDGTLAAARAIAGDRVRAGDVLCELDRREPELQAGELRAQLAVCQQDRQRAMAAAAPVEARLAEANEHLAQAKLRIVERRLEQTLVRSPIDGVVVNGDMRTRVGAVLPQGTPLFEVAPLSNWRLELRAPQTIAADLSRDITGRFANHARPEVTQPFRLTHVRPRPEPHEGRNVYIAEGEIAVDTDWMRPGMEGLAKVHLGRRAVWWVTLHRAIDYLRLNFWL